MADFYTETDLRYLKNTHLEPERLMVKEWFRDLIHNYGIDVCYFRKHLSFYEVPSGMANYTYGEETTSTYYLSAPMVIYCEVLSDSHLLNGFGIQTNMDIKAFCTIDDFKYQFEDLLGTLTSGFFISTLSGQLTNYKGYVSGSFANQDISGITSGYVEINLSGQVCADYDFGIVDYKPVNPNILFPNYYSYFRTTTGMIAGTWTATVDASGNGSISGDAESVIWYFTPPEKNHGPGWLDIAPQVGDFFRIQFDDSNHEEYLINEVTNRLLTSDGLNPLLSKYIFKMTCVRRDPSYENLTDGTTPEEEKTTSKIEQNTWHENVSNNIFDYVNPVDAVDGANSDSVYGKYG